MAKIPTISQQMSGNINEILNAKRRQMNEEIREIAEEYMKKEKGVKFIKESN